eukprot:gene17126-23430_t
MRRTKSQSKSSSKGDPLGREQQKHEEDTESKQKKQGSFQDLGNPKRRVTDCLLVINIVCFALQWLSKDLLTFWGCKVNSYIAAGQWWRLITPAFLHSSVFHLLINSHAINSLGPQLEIVSGGPRFLSAVFGIGAALAVFYYRHKGLLGRYSENGLAHFGGAIGGALAALLLGPHLISNVAGRFVDRPLLPLLATQPQITLEEGGKPKRRQRQSPNSDRPPLKDQDQDQDPPSGLGGSSQLEGGASSKSQAGQQGRGGGGWQAGEFDSFEQSLIPIHRRRRGGVSRGRNSIGGGARGSQEWEEARPVSESQGGAGQHPQGQLHPEVAAHRVGSKGEGGSDGVLTKDGAEPIHLAAKYLAPELVEILMSNGADAKVALSDRADTEQKLSVSSCIGLWSYYYRKGRESVSQQESATDYRASADLFPLRCITNAKLLVIRISTSLRQKLAN